MGRKLTDRPGWPAPTCRDAKLGSSEPNLPHFCNAANGGLRCAGSSHDLFHVAHVGATTSSQNLNMWELSPDI